MLNVGAIQGRLTAEPELRKTQTNTSVCSFTVACERNFVKQGEERVSDFIDCVAWGKAADFICKYFHKGSMIAVQGAIETRNWEDKNGSKRKTTEINVAQASFCDSKGNAMPNIEIETPSNEGTYQEVPDFDDIPNEADFPF